MSEDSQSTSTEINRNLEGNLLQLKYKLKALAGFCHKINGEGLDQDELNGLGWMLEGLADKADSCMRAAVLGASQK